MLLAHHVTILALLPQLSRALLPKGPPEGTSAVQSRFTGRLGDAIRLICPIRADPEPLIEWYRDGERVTEFWDRYRIGSKGFSLTIQRLECDDEGTYVCKAINGFGVHEISFQLNLSNGANEEMVCSSSSSSRSVSETSFPVVVVAGTSGQVPVMLHKQKKNRHWLKPAGSYALLKCTATATPLPKIRWFKDGVEVGVKEEQPVNGKYVVRAAVLTSPSVTEEEHADAGDARSSKAVRSTLQIGDLRGADSAKYTCRAENAHGIDEIAHILEVVERQIPSRPELHPHFPSNTWLTSGQPGSLVCKVKSEFPPDVHWMKRLDVEVAADEEIDESRNEFIPNRTITIGKTQYQILPSAPAIAMSDGFYLSKWLTNAVSEDGDSGMYVCLALNNAGYNYRQVYLNVTRQPLDKTTSISSSRQDWADKNRADATTTTVVIVIVIVGLTGMVASCFVWNKRKQQLDQKVVSAALQSPVAPTPHVTWTSPLPPTTPPNECCKFQVAEEILPATGSGGSSSQEMLSISQEGHRVYYFPARMASQRQQHHRRNRERSRHHRSAHPAVHSARVQHSVSIRKCYPSYPEGYLDVPQHSHIRLPWPSPETSFDQSEVGESLTCS